MVGMKTLVTAKKQERGPHGGDEDLGDNEKRGQMSS